MLLILGSAQGLQVINRDGDTSVTPCDPRDPNCVTPTPAPPPPAPPATPAPTFGACRRDSNCPGYETCKRSGMSGTCEKGYCPADVSASCTSSSCAGFGRTNCKTTCYHKYGCLAPRTLVVEEQNVTTTRQETGDVGQETGDPHLQNIFGQRFDLMQPGRHVLLHIPRAASASATLLRVQADARHEGGQCADMYFKALNVTGAWVGTDGHTYSADAPQKSHGWMTAGKVEFKVAWGHTLNGIQYLNFYVRHLKLVDHEIGGLLGMDDFKEAATSNAWCKDVIQLRQGISDRNASFAVADM